MKGHVYQRHYTVQEARKLLPKIIGWFDEIDSLRVEFGVLEEKTRELTGKGDDAGGAIVDRRIKTLAEITGLLREFKRREIQIKDLEQGLIDFPAIIDGNEVFLCWKKGEATIDYWHDLESGFAGRQPLQED